MLDKVHVLYLLDHDRRQETLLAIAHANPKLSNFIPDGNKH